jgi:protein-arginine deiminase
MRRLFFLSALVLGCGSSAEDVPVIRLAVDADRDGVIHTEANAPDVVHRAEWSAQFGAVFLANVDDDDADGKVDATDAVVNGDADALDLARVQLAAWKNAPTGATATVTPDQAAAPFVRLFRHDGSAWTAWDPTAAFTDADLRAGVELGVEANDFANPTWSGALTLHYAVADRDGKPLGTDDAALHVAPLLLQSNLGTVDRAYVTAFQGDPDSDPFVADVLADATGDSVPLVEIDGNQYPDQWTQDLFEVGWTGMPSAAGVQSMYVVIRTPPPDRTAADYTQEGMLAADFGWVWKRSQPYNRNGDEGSLDSFGDLDAIPPYGAYPFGRVLIGSTPLRHMDDALRDFLNAQVVQGPNFYVDTAWLFVGHVDEIVSFVKANTPRGWKLVMASPARARKILQDLVTADPANANVKLFADVLQYDARGQLVGGGVAISTILGDATLMADNQVAQTKIDGVRAALKAEIGLADDEILDVPVLFEDIGGDLAYSAGVVNLLHMDGRAGPPRAHGPVVAGKDAFEDDFEKTMTAIGVTTAWVEDWNLYHLEEGEVHCGTNVTRKVPANFRWWEVTR